MAIIRSLVILLTACLAVTGDKPVDVSSFVKLAHYTTESSKAVDTVIFVSDTITPDASTTTLQDAHSKLYEKLKKFNEMDTSFMDKPSVHAILDDTTTIDRLIFSPTGNLLSDTADGRTVYEASMNAFNLAHESGAENILLVLGEMKNANEQPWGKPKYKYLNAILGALYALYVPIEIRDLSADNIGKYKKLYISGEKTIVDWAIKYANAIEQGRWIARDICGSDPERMSTSNIIKYMDLYLPTNENIARNVFSINEAEYPLMAAVNRASDGIDRHDGKVVKMTYKRVGSTPKKILQFIGKGITMDTGGMDLKVKGAMVGMHRDKCGAAAIVGFFKTLDVLQVTDYEVRAKLAFVRNNIGAKAYTLDEIIMSRAGKRIRIVNTDAEGRMVMVDLLTEAKEESLKDIKESKEVQIFTVATLTGHVIRCYKYIMGAIENGPSKEAKVLESMQESADKMSDLLEISTLRKEDYDFNVGPMETEDYMQANNKPSTATDRGHQYPAAFLMQASGLDAHGRNMGNQELKFIHLDVAGSVGSADMVPTASPLTMLASHYLVKE